MAKKEIATTDTIPVFCRYSKIEKIQNIKTNKRNPNKHPAEQIERLAFVIEKNGWRNPIVISNLSGLVVKGEGRLLAAQRLGLSCVPIEYQDYKTPADEMSDLIADNKIAELSEADNEEILSILDNCKEVDIQGCGMTKTDIESIKLLLDKPTDILPDTTYIDELLKKEEFNTTTTRDNFSITFVFDKKYEEQVQGYIKKNGKDAIVAIILQEVGGEENA